MGVVSDHNGITHQPQADTALPTADIKLIHQTLTYQFDL